MSIASSHRPLFRKVIFCALTLSILHCGTCLARDGDPEAQVSGFGSKSRPTGNWLYDYQALIGTIVAGLAVLVTFLNAERGRRLEILKYREEKEQERRKSYRQKSIILKSLMEDIQFLSDDTSQLHEALVDLLHQLTTEELRDSVSILHVKNVLSSCRPRSTLGTLVDKGLDQIFDSHVIVQQLTRVNGYLKGLANAADWCQQMIEQDISGTERLDADAAERLIEMQSTRLINSIKDLQSVIRSEVAAQPA